MIRKYTFHILTFITIIFQMVSAGYSQNAPITTVATVSVCPPGTVIVPVTVVNFNAIGAVTLRIEYNTSQLTFNPYPASFVNPILPGAAILATPVGSGINKIMITWSGGTNTQNLSNGATLATLSFTYASGNNTLTFNNTSNGGADCEFANGAGTPLNDIPTTTYYINGAVNTAGAGPAGQVIGQTTVCQLASGLTYTVAPITNATSYVWTVPSGVNITAGNGTNTITVTFGPTAVSGNFCVYGTNSCASGSTSCLAVTVNPIPGQAGAITGPVSICSGSTGNVYSIAAVANATGYLWTVPTGWVITGGQNTTSINVTAGSTNGNITVTPNNNCGSSNTSSLNVTATQLPVANAGPDQVIGYGSSTILNGLASGGSGNYAWHWEPAALLINPNAQNPLTVNLTFSVQFTLTATDAITTCIGTDQVLVTVAGGPLSVTVTGDPNPDCEGQAVQLLALVTGGTGTYSFTWTSNPPGFSSNLQNPTATPAESTTYMVSIFDGFATVEDSVHIIVNPLPDVPQTPTGPDTVDVRSVITSDYFTHPIPSVVSFIWSLTPSAAGAIAGTDTTGTVTWNPGYLGYAHITVKGINSCGESGWSAEKLTLVDNTTAVQHNDSDPGIVIYPNPSDGHFHLILTSRVNEAYGLRILNNLGIIIFEKNHIQVDGISDQNIDLQSPPKGLYIVELTGKRENILRKILIH
jgi:large repetitive protein